jgi:spermidine synthase
VSKPASTCNAVAGHGRNGGIRARPRYPGQVRARPGVVIALCFFLSGATGLVYQVVWLRMLGLVFGHTVHAITTVLTAFMAGLALGSFLFARRSAGIRDLVRAYGLMEIAIGLYCAAIPLLFWLAAWVYMSLHRTLGLSFTAFTLLQFALISVVLLVPTTLMGGTLPVLSQALARDDRRLGRTISLLYGINTLGAVVGTVLAGYFVLPALGNRLTVAVAAAANLAVGVLAIAYARLRPEENTAIASPPAERASVPVATGGAVAAPGGTASSEPEPATPLGARLTVAALAISGAVSMMYEVAWTRALALVLGSSTYAFTSMLVAFLVGIAGGSALYGWVWGTRRASPAIFGVLQLATGLAAAAVVAGFDRLPELFLAGLRWSSSPAAVQTLQIVVSATALLVFTVFIGATFPCAVAVAAHSARHAGRDVGYIYAMNTLGAIAGSALAGFVAVPALGVQSSIKIGIAVNLALAAVLFLVSRGRKAARLPAAAGALAVGLAVLALPAWDQRVLSSAPAVYGQRLLQHGQNRSLSELLRPASEVLFYRDGPSATVSVLRSERSLVLKVNGKSDASDSLDMPTQVLSGQIPLLVRPDAKRVLVIGLGSGVTAGAVARHPVERIDIVELEPAVVEANRFFADLNGHVLSDPRTRVLVADGRNVILTAAEGYDVIISEPSNPWISGLASLFTVEFFGRARERLRPGGVMLQWIQLYGLPAEDLRMVVASFRTAFPVATMWQGTPGDMLMLGQTDDAPVDLPALKRRFESHPSVAQDLGRIGITDWADVLSYFVLTAPELARYSAGAALNTDDRLPLEFSAPRALYLPTAQGNLNQLRRAALARLPEVTPGSTAELSSAHVQYRIGHMYLRRGVNADALPWFERALNIDRQHVPSLLGASRASFGLARWTIARELAQRALSADPQSSAALHALGVASMALSDKVAAVRALERAVAIEPGNREYRNDLAKASMQP